MLGLNIHLSEDQLWQHIIENHWNVFSLLVIVNCFWTDEVSALTHNFPRAALITLVSAVNDDELAPSKLNNIRGCYCENTHLFPSVVLCSVAGLILLIQMNHIIHASPSAEHVILISLNRLHFSSARWLFCCERLVVSHNTNLSSLGLTWVIKLHLSWKEREAFQPPDNSGLTLIEMHHGKYDV